MSWTVLLLLVPEAVCHGVWRDGGHLQYSLGGGAGLCAGPDRGDRPQGTKVRFLLTTVLKYSLDIISSTLQVF